MEQRSSHLLNIASLNPFNLIFPKVCFNCSTRLKDSERFICSVCRKELLPYYKSFCELCGAYNVESGQICIHCFNNEYEFDKCRSVTRFNDVTKKLIHELKYNEMTQVADIFSSLAIDYLEKVKPFDRIDYVISVPLHIVRKRTRGYNQSEIIAKKIASHFNWSYVPSIIKKHKATLSQANLSAKARLTNVENAFSVDSKNRIEESNLLIIDDVFTTGSTVNEISRTLKRHHINKVYVLTMTRA